MAIAAWGWESGDRTYYTQMGWTLSAASVTPATTDAHRSVAGHGGTYSLTIPVSQNAISPTFSTTARWVHFWWRATESTIFGVTFRRSGSANWSVLFLADGGLELHIGPTNGAIQQTDIYSAPNPVGNWIAIQLTSANAGGTCEVWINGVQVSTFSGDTQSTATADWDSVQFTNGVGGVTLFVDDIIVTTAAEGRLTERFLPALRPDGNDAVQFTPVGSANNWENVDEVPASTVDYNSETTTTEQDTYTLANVPWTVPSGGVHAVVVNGYCSREGGLTQAELITKPTTTSFYATPVTLPSGTTYGALTDVRNTNPDTAAAWAPADVDGLKIGVRFTT